MTNVLEGVSRLEADPRVLIARDHDDLALYREHRRDIAGILFDFQLTGETRQAFDAFIAERVERNSGRHVIDFEFSEPALTPADGDPIVLKAHFDGEKYQQGLFGTLPDSIQPVLLQLADLYHLATGYNDVTVSVRINSDYPLIYHRHGAALSFNVSGDPTLATADEQAHNSDSLEFDSYSAGNEQGFLMGPSLLHRAPPLSLTSKAEPRANVIVSHTQPGVQAF